MQQKSEIALCKNTIKNGQLKKTAKGTRIQVFLSAYNRSKNLNMNFEKHMHFQLTAAMGRKCFLQKFSIGNPVLKI